jgi:hypothetical protein
MAVTSFADRFIGDVLLGVAQELLGGFKASIESVLFSED